MTHLPRLLELSRAPLFTLLRSDLFEAFVVFLNFHFPRSVRAHLLKLLLLSPSPVVRPLNPFRVRLSPSASYVVLTVSARAASLHWSLPFSWASFRVAASRTVLHFLRRHLILMRLSCNCHSASSATSNESPALVSAPSSHGLLPWFSKAAVPLRLALWSAPTTGIGPVMSFFFVPLFVILVPHDRSLPLRPTTDILLVVVIPCCSITTVTCRPCVLPPPASKKAVTASSPRFAHSCRYGVGLLGRGSSRVVSQPRGHTSVVFLSVR